MFTYPQQPAFPYFFYVIADRGQQNSQLFQPIMMIPELGNLPAFQVNPNLAQEGQNESPKSKDQAKLMKHQPDAPAEEIKSLNKQLTDLQSEFKNKSGQLPQKKPNRPLKYLTEKAFYMKQILRGRMRSQKRMLRRKQMINSKQSSPSELSESECKEQAKRGQIICKPEPVKQVVASKKSEFHSSSQFTRTSALIPAPMAFDHGFSLFVSKKREQLISRSGLICQQPR